MSKDFPVKGLAELDRFLSALPKNMQRNAYSAGLRAAAKVVQDEARVRAPKKTGQMAKGIKYGSVHRNQDGTLSIFIRPTGQHGFLALFHEYGVQPHLISASAEDKAAHGAVGTMNKNAKSGSLVIGGNFVGPMVQHPGHAAHPFMRPALDAKAGEAVQAFAGRIRDYLEGKTGFAAPMDEAA